MMGHARYTPFSSASLYKCIYMMVGFRSIDKLLNRGVNRWTSIKRSQGIESFAHPAQFNRPKLPVILVARKTLWQPRCRSSRTQRGTSRLGDVYGSILDAIQDMVPALPRCMRRPQASGHYRTWRLCARLTASRRSLRWRKQLPPGDEGPNDVPQRLRTTRYRNRIFFLKMPRILHSSRIWTRDQEAGLFGFVESAGAEKPHGPHLPVGTTPPMA
jgi:hypothetical protein